MRSSPSIHKLYLFFTVCLLLTLGVGVFTNFEFIATLYKTSVPINSIIIFVIWSSICLALAYIVSACREITVFQQFTKWCDDKDNVDFDVDKVKAGFLGSVLKPIILSVEHHGSAVVGSTSETRSMVESYEQSVSSRAKLVTFLGGFLVLLGLLGTFLGLTITLQSMGVILSKLAGGLQDSADTSILKVMIELIMRLKEPMAGMGTAFSTSLFGLAGSGVVSVMSVILSRVHDQLKWHLESWLSGQVRFANLASSGSEGADDIAFPVDGALPEQLLAFSEQMSKNNDEVKKSLSDSNKFLLEMTIQQKQSVEVYRNLEKLNTESKKQISLGNELTGRLLKDTRQMLTVLETIAEQNQRLQQEQQTDAAEQQNSAAHSATN